MAEQEEGKTCSYLFDMSWYCLGIRNQLTTLRSHGRYSNCYDLVTDWLVCLRLKLQHDEEKKKVSNISNATCLCL